MKYIKLFSLIILLPLTILTQNESKEIELFDTYENFSNKKGKVIGEYKGFSFLNIPNRFFLKHNNGTGEEIKREITGIWGFRIGTSLFRLEGRKEGPMMVFSIGKYIYYEIGILHLRMISGGSAWTSDENDWTYYSKTLESEILSHSKFMKEKKLDASLIEFCDCVKLARSTTVKYGKYDEYLRLTRECVAKYN